MLECKFQANSFSLKVLVLDLSANTKGPLPPVASIKEEQPGPLLNHIYKGAPSNSG